MISKVGMCVLFLITAMWIMSCDDGSDDGPAEGTLTVNATNGTENSILYFSVVGADVPLTDLQTGKIIPTGSGKASIGEEGTGTAQLMEEDQTQLYKLPGGDYQLAILVDVEPFMADPSKQDDFSTGDSFGVVKGITIDGDTTFELDIDANIMMVTP